MSSGLGAALVADGIQQLNSLRPDVLFRVADIIREFNARPPEGIDAQYVRQVVDDLTNAYFMPPFQFLKPSEVWRVRGSDPGVRYDNADDLRYPPPAHSDQGRVNANGKPMFYAAAAPATCFAESRKKKDDYFHLTRYEIRPDPNCFLLQVGLLDTLRRGQDLDHPGAKNHIESTLAQLRPDVVRATQLVDAFFFDHMSRKGSLHQYAITNAIASSLMDDTRTVGLLYPSVEHRGGTNFALRSEFYDTHVIPKQVSIEQIVYEFGYGSVDTVRHGPAPIDPATGKIGWNDGDWYADLRDSAAAWHKITGE